MNINTMNTLENVKKILKFNECAITKSKLMSF